MWAEPLGRGRYRIRNVPFYAYGISFGDVVRAAGHGADELLMERVEDRSGHSTYRIFVEEEFTPESPEFGQFWQPVEQTGANYERGSDMLLAVDVPPSSNIDRVFQLLTAGESAGVWLFEEGHCGHPDCEETED